MMNRDHSNVRIRSAIRKHSQPIKNTLNESQRMRKFSNEEKKEIEKESKLAMEDKLISVKSESALDKLSKRSYTPLSSPNYISNFEKTKFSVSKAQTFKTLVSIKEPNFKNQESLILITQNPISAQENGDFQRTDGVFGERKLRRTARVSTLKLNVRAIKNLDKIEEDDYTGSEDTFFKTPQNKIIDQSLGWKKPTEKIFSKKAVKAFLIDTNYEEIKIQPKEEKKERVNLNSEAKKLADFRIKIRGNTINKSQERSSVNKNKKDSEIQKIQIDKKQSSKWAWKGANGFFSN